MAAQKKKKKLTVADLIALKGQRKLVLVTAFDEWTARAAEEAGVDMIVSWGCGFEATKAVVQNVRRGAPNTLIGSGINPGAYASTEAALRLAEEIRAAGTDIIYCSGLVPDKFASLARQHYPCCGHVGYLPVNDTWYGGPRAVGKTAKEALKLYRDVMELEAAGCIAIEMECVPAKVAAEITRRTNMLVFGMGSGPDTDGQFVFAEDILGTNTGHYPRHAVTYTHLLKDAVGCFSRFKDDVVSGAYPAPRHSIIKSLPEEEFAGFMAAISSHAPCALPATVPHKHRSKKLTVADLIALKGQRKLVLVTAFDEWTARAAEEAGVDMIVSWGNGFEATKAVVQNVRRGAPNTLIGSGINPGAYRSVEDALQLAEEIRAAGTDIIYCSGLTPDKFAGLARQHYPCCGHVGYLPVNDTWFGGPRAVGKTTAEAKKVYDDVMALEAAGCIAVEMECVPAKVATEITRRTKMLVFGMGSGPDTDGQFVFAEDLLGNNTEHYPRHATTYSNMLDEAVKCFKQFREDVLSGAYPAAKHSILKSLPQQEFDGFLAGLRSNPLAPHTWLAVALCSAAAAAVLVYRQKR